jgi:Protein tyrosine and serine/threonine kinase
MESDSVTLAEVLADWADDDDTMKFVTDLVPPDVLRKKLRFAFKNGKSTGLLERLVRDKNLSAEDDALFISFMANCEEWSKEGFTRPKRKYEAYAEYPSPSKFGRGEWVEMQKIHKKNVIWCLRPHQFSWINIRIMHKVFHEVVRAYMNGKPEPQDYDLAEVLSVAMADDYPFEDDRQDAINKLLNDGLFHSLDLHIEKRNVRTTRYNTDGSAREHGINFEYKNEKGDGGGDPYMQNMGYYVHFIARISAEDHQKHCCPWLLVEVAGQQMGIAGAALTFEGPCAQPLTPNEQFLPTPADPETILRQGRLCMALRVGCAGLKAFYDGAVSLPKLRNKQSNFPYPHSAKIGGTDVEFEYTECLGGRAARKMVFLAKRSDNDGRIVVKFTDRYSEAVHRELAGAGLAPALHDVQGVSGLQMVVMDYVGNARMWDSRKDRETHALKDQLERVLEVLKNNGFVHGDLRAANILVKDTGEISILDFDWAGKAGETEYKNKLNPNLHWPEGAKLGAPITAAHDRFMIHSVLLALPPAE